MKIAIHKEKGTFSDRWIQYCDENHIPYKIVSCYDSNIIDQLADCNGLMWHWNQEDYKAVLFARQLTLSLDKKRFKVYPDVNTAWHFDDKIGQKYLFEALKFPFVKSHIFYTKKQAFEWIDKTEFPKVFKLRGGAGSINVKLVKTKKHARTLARKSFRNGFSTTNSLSRLKDKLWVIRRDKNTAALTGFLKTFARIFIPTENNRLSSNQKGYIYFQDFIPKNDYDTRLVVIGNRCFGVRRYCRDGDFRASGSGVKAYEPELFDKRCIKIAFDIAKRLNSQSLAMDFVMDGNEPKIIEMSYGFITGRFYDDCMGFWDSDLNHHDQKINPQYFIIEDFLKDLNG